MNGGVSKEQTCQFHRQLSKASERKLANAVVRKRAGMYDGNALVCGEYRTELQRTDSSEGRSSTRHTRAHEKAAQRIYRGRPIADEESPIDWDGHTTACS